MWKDIIRPVILVKQAQMFGVLEMGFDSTM
jgi:hypothetical protein